MPEFRDSVDPPGGYDCQRQPGDETSEHTHETILVRLDEMLAPTGGSYSQSQLPAKQAIQYSIIALNRQNHDALMQLISVLPQTIIGRNQYCEDVLNRLAAPFKRTIRGRIKAQQNAVQQLINQLGNAVTARTAYSRQMLNDCQCKMLGAEQPSNDTPMGEGESGIPSQSPDSSGRDYPATPSEPIKPTRYIPQQPSTECNLWDICPDGYAAQWFKHFWEFELPKLIAIIANKQPITVNVAQSQFAGALADANAAEWNQILLDFAGKNPDEAAKQKYGAMDDIIPDPPQVGMQPSPIEDEHFPIENL